VCLHPGKSYIELRVRLCNRTPFMQTFLWWADAGVHVHELYQSFFPPDSEDGRRIPGQLGEAVWGRISDPSWTHLGIPYDRAAGSKSLR